MCACVCVCVCVGVVTSSPSLGMSGEGEDATGEEEDEDEEGEDAEAAVPPGRTSTSFFNFRSTCPLFPGERDRDIQYSASLNLDSIPLPCQCHKMSALPPHRKDPIPIPSDLFLS